ncbi:MAG: hypothetical protein ACKO16_09430 [Gemmataceae bacterium]
MSLDFFVKTKDKEFGPLSERKIKDLLDSGDISPNDEIRHVNSNIWIKINKVINNISMVKPNDFPSNVISENPPSYDFIQILANMYKIGGFIFSGIIFFAIIYMLIVIIFPSASTNNESIIFQLIYILVFSIIGSLTCFAFGQILNMATKSAQNIHMILYHISKK